MIEHLVADQATVVEAAKKLVQAAEAAGDEATTDLGGHIARPPRLKRGHASRRAFKWRSD